MALLLVSVGELQEHAALRDDRVAGLQAVEHLGLVALLTAQLHQPLRELPGATCT